MQKQTLQFQSLMELCSFAKALTGGYVINTINLTLTTTVSADQPLPPADQPYAARLIPTTDKVYSYAPLC